MIDIRKLKELVRLMVDNDLTEIDLRDSEEQVTMRRPNSHGTPQVIQVPAYHAPAHSAVRSSQPLAAVPAAIEEEAGLHKIESPMVGTFYASANPDLPPFVTVGTAISADKTVCIIEAMKIFNEIKAECSGTVEKILVKSGRAVEFGQPLFLVRPA